MLGHYTELERTEKVCRRNVKSPIYSLSLFPTPAPSPKFVVVQNGRYYIFLLGLIKFEVFQRHCTGPEAWTLCVSRALVCGGCCILFSTEQSPVFLTKYHLALLASLFVQTVSEVVETIDLKA